MTLISLEEVQKILSKISNKYQSEYTGGWIASKVQEEINSLPTINPTKIIEDMIEEYRNKGYGWEEIEIIEEVSNRINQ